MPLSLPFLLAFLLTPLFLQVPLVLLSWVIFAVVRRMRPALSSLSPLRAALKVYVCAVAIHLPVWLAWHGWWYLARGSVISPPFLVASPQLFLLLGSLLYITILRKSNTFSRTALAPVLVSFVAVSVAIFALRLFYGKVTI